MRERPSHLPNFKAPPINEVVIGVQYAQPTGYQQIRAGEVWALYRTDYPKVEEQPPLAPAFETFGGRSSNILQFGIATGATHDRFWFLSDKKDELIQFQADRLLHNWRKVGDGTNPYPHFESMIEKFQAELLTLEAYFSSLASQQLAINQAEISYVNHIALVDTFDPGQWVRFLTFPGGHRPDDLTFAMRRMLVDPAGKPLARLIVEANSALTDRGQQLLVLTLTVRGAPHGTTIYDAVDFISTGRETIVTTFAEITTESAHKKWERIQ
ncbi:MAG TPA: TIGR04255 family protein [Rhizomicrobium sp.]|jgi:uncharacterized protein (TIGR04255 family)|nr:TIGR04255 family protein [Rhizomicrobium sp.]